MVLVVKNPPATAGDTREPGSITGSGRSSAEGHGNPLQYSWRIPWAEENPWVEENPMAEENLQYSWRIPWAEGPDGLCSIDHKKSDTTEAT